MLFPQLTRCLISSPTVRFIFGGSFQMENPTWSIPVKVDETFHHLSLVKGTPPGDSARTFCGRTAMNADNCATLVEAAERFAREQHKKNTASIQSQQRKRKIGIAGEMTKEEGDGEGAGLGMGARGN